MTSLTSDPPCWVDAPREGINNVEDFVRTFLWLLQAGALQENDILFMDNAAIHFARDIRETLVGMAAVFRVQIMFLPTYSPELNPCELVFQWVKARLRLDKAASHCGGELTRDLMVQW